MYTIELAFRMVIEGICANVTYYVTGCCVWVGGAALDGSGLGVSSHVPAQPLQWLLSHSQLPVLFVQKVLLSIVFNNELINFVHNMIALLNRTFHGNNTELGVYLMMAGDTAVFSPQMNNVNN